MAEDKKSFILYADSYGLIKQLPDEIAGKLLKHIFAYVNDENPETDNLLVNIAFEPIKQQLKRDLQKWDKNKLDKSINGRMGNLKRYNLDIYNDVLAEKINLEDAENIAKSRKMSLSDVLPSLPVAEDSNPIAKLAVNDSVSVSVNVNDTVNVINKKISISERKINFRYTLEPFLQTYGKEVLNAFFLYWTEPNLANTKMRFEMQKTWSISLRLSQWANRDKTFKTPTTQTDKPIHTPNPKKQII